MILLANGCSWTYGGSLNLDSQEQTSQRLQSVWPYHLGQTLGASDVVNLAAGCGSNQRIIRTTFDWLIKQTPSCLSDTVAVIQWTSPERYEYYDPVDHHNSLENISDRWARVKIDVCLQSKHSEYDFAFERSQRRFETTSYQESMYETVSRVSALSLMFENFGVKYFYWNQYNMAYMYPQDIKEFYCNRFPWIDHPSEGGIEMKDEYIWKYDRISSTDAHPSFQGHQDLADIIYKKIKDRI